MKLAALRRMCTDATQRCTIAHLAAQPCMRRSLERAATTITAMPQIGSCLGASLLPAKGTVSLP
jgi:hypothetical protein